MEVSLPRDPLVLLRNAGELRDVSRAPEIEHVVEYVMEHVIEHVTCSTRDYNQAWKISWQGGREKRGKYAPAAQSKLRLVASSVGCKREINI